uniref:ATP synthase F0 subunit 8 n=1 Tax=Placobdella lamothei TaxID=1514856 RepID=A0A175D396_9ANNE|nr:ATP synthase F0 subunit 8 [Placobdella lamothei]CVK87346.1 ATP synthase F0 subunit 8 [Placobdella lamothei]
MPHLSPMTWATFFIILWGLMAIIITSMWWFMYSPMNPTLTSTMNLPNSDPWKW